MNPRLILCPTELRGTDRPALEHAIALARWYGSELHVLRVGAGRDPGSTPAPIADPGRLRLTDVVGSADPAREVNLTDVELTGDPVEATIDYGRLSAADLVVTGRIGRQGRWFRGSGGFAAAVGRALDCPTLVITGGAGHDEPPFRNVLCAVDFSPASHRALTQALTLAQQSGGRLEVLYVLEDLPYEMQAAGRSLGRPDDWPRIREVARELRSLVPLDAYDWCDVQTSVESGEAQDVILAVASERAADLIVLGHPRRSRLERIVAGSTAGGILRRANAPVLLVPGPARAPAAASPQPGAEHVAGVAAGDAGQRLQA